jgi:hypothetical protein
MGWGADMTKPSGTDDKNSDLNENFMAEDTDSPELDGNEEALPPRVNHKDPTVRRKIEDRLERKRLREELGIYDEDAWKDI